ncbi:hypothetical protein B0H11DRAFT_2414003 [Mycena galericulata]|nr:hypothetical protein B0H11DRAFT_2414003 [Mycena galericulata]
MPYSPERACPPNNPSANNPSPPQDPNFPRSKLGGSALGCACGGVFFAVKEPGTPWDPLPVPAPVYCTKGHGVARQGLPPLHCLVRGGALCLWASTGGRLRLNRISVDASTVMSEVWVQPELTSEQISSQSSSSLPTFSFNTTAEEVATALAAEIQGKNVLITGTSINGIGFEAARVIAKHANLIKTLRNFPLQTSAASPLILDRWLLSAKPPQKSIHMRSPSMCVLIHNAAAVIGPFKLTADGLESQFGIDHLLASASQTYTPRVIFVSSAAHAMGTGVDFDAIAAPDREKYSITAAYCQAKSANILTAIELSKRSGGKINAYSLHPGGIYTNINQEESIPEMQALGILGPDGLPNKDKFQWKTIPEGAATTVAAAFDPRISDQPGAYLDDSTVANQAVVAHSSDPAIAARLWTVLN